MKAPECSVNIIPDRHWIQKLPKAELHLHIEGTLEPELMFKLSERNRVPLKFSNVEQIRSAYKFFNLDDFLKIYYQGMSVLQTEQDFFDLTMAYMQRAYQDGVCHAEIFFDPQGHVTRGVSFDTVINGIVGALQESEKTWKISSRLIMCFLRHLSEADAFATLQSASPYIKYLTAVGLDSSELGNPPSKFQRVFSAARAQGLRCVAHAGEEGPPAYISEAIQLLKIDRLDHGNRAIEDPELISYLAKKGMTLTLCPLSNLRLGVIKDLREYPLRLFLDAGVSVTINSDDPAYFGGYILDNYCALVDSLQLNHSQVAKLAFNSFTGSFLDCEKIREQLQCLAQVTYV